MDTLGRTEDFEKIDIRQLELIRRIFINNKNSMLFLETLLEDDIAKRLCFNTVEQNSIGINIIDRMLKQRGAF